MKYLHLIRFQNLVFIALAQYCIKYGLFHPSGIDITLNDWEFFLLVLATVSIAAAGNTINDIYDIEIDKINKPQKVLVGKRIGINTANNLFIILNVVGVSIGYYLSNSIGKPAFAGLFIVISALLYLYASYLKGMLLVGNLLISALVAMSLIIVGLFDLMPGISPTNQADQSMLFKIVLQYSLFAFSLNFIREIVKDLQDINGDKKGEMNTLPIAIGRKRTVLITFILGVLMVCGVLFYMYEYLYSHQIILLYFLFTIIGPLLLFCIKAWDAKTKKDFAFLSSLLKIVMVTGICSMMLFQSLS